MDVGTVNPTKAKEASNRMTWKTKIPGPPKLATCLLKREEEVAGVLLEASALFLGKNAVYADWPTRMTRETAAM